MELEVQIESQMMALPVEADFQRWVDVAAAGVDPETEIVIRIVDREESADLNAAYRGKTGPTNVLSFPFQAPPETGIKMLGDLVICAPVVADEAEDQGKPGFAHWAHMVVHGTLHLLGYDHVNNDDAEIMESRERDILAKLGFPDPYL
ncbi:MAG: rRNA maturation RNase YbeY [Gammaproteobacteria bacterium]|nr:rRNA maturation RNase YbeY [Gammaproteobacteria bacterium]MCP5136737.1 rRNA maturation RNase YbeY [Gammaproteobacteria bacterium]